MLFAVVLALSALSLHAHAAEASATDLPAPTGLMCDLLAMPDRTEIRSPQPAFTWVMRSDEKDDWQTAYQIRVTAVSHAQETANLWESGKRASEHSVAVRYDGKPLESRRAYQWQVRLWNRRGRISAWSSAQTFRTGDLTPVTRDGERATTARYPLVQTPVAPRTVREIAPGHTFVDFGRDAYAALKLTLISPDSRSIVVHLGESLDGADKVNRRPGGSIRYHRVEMPLQQGTHTYLVPLPEKDLRRMPPEIGAVMPFRYVEIENAPAALDRDAIRQVTVHYPFEDTAAAFSSSDARLDAVWELCRYSMKATSFCGLYVDGDRERLPYEADAYLNMLGHYAADREFTLARSTHEYLMQHATWPTEWILHSVLIAWADYLHTGDDRSLRAFYADLKAKTLLVLAREDGLLSTAPPAVTKEILASVHSTRMQDIVDWPLGERDGYEMRPVNTVVNAFHYRALVLMERIATALEKPDEARYYGERARRVREAFNRVFWSEVSGLYVDGEGSTHSSQHANMFALAFGLVPPERVRKVADFVVGKGMACSVYGAQYLLEALYEAGRSEHALALLTAENDRSWLHMIRAVGSTITLEAWDNKYKPNQDWNHAWGAAPANIIPRFVMGVEPLEPGFRTVRIRPQSGGLTRASFDLPTVRGTIHTDFTAAVKRFALRVVLPANMTARVYVPCLGSNDLTLKVDGAARAGKRDGDFLIVEGIGAGEHTLVRQIP